jgi:hypothetical protein
VTTTERENVPRPDGPEDEAPEQDDSVTGITELDEEDLVEDDGPSAGERPLVQSGSLASERPRRAYDSIMDYVPSTTMGEVVRPTPAWRLPVVSIAGLALVGGGVFVAFGMSSEPPVEEMVVQSTSPAVVEVLPGDTEDTSGASDDEVTDDEILIIEEDEETVNEGADAKRGSASRSKRRRGRGRSRGQRPPPGANIVELDRLTVRRTIRSRMVHLHRCYDDALERNPDLAGRLEIEITIGIQGNVTHAAIKRDALRHDPTKSCILAMLKGWRFHIDGWLRRPVDVSFPVVFSG